MEKTLPVKNLIRLNCVLSLVVSGIVCLFLFQVKNQEHQLLNTIMTFVIITVIGFSHLGILITVNRAFGTKQQKLRFYRYLFTYLAAAAAYLVIWPFFAPYTHPGWRLFDLSLLFIFIGSGALVNTMFIVLYDFVLLQNEKAHADLELSRLKTTHAEAANLLLKQQIHPHFLFNALNTLKALYRKDPGAGDSYIVHLANFLRASVDNHDAKISRLDEELNLLNDYLEMQKIRFGAALDCIIDIPEEILRNHYLPSFSLQPLLENAIKHNDLTLRAPLTVNIIYREGRIIVYNNLKRKTIKPPSANHGLANLAERYRLWSGDEVIIKEEKDTFAVSIKLLTNEYSDHRG